jgi:hypothetical protein
MEMIFFSVAECKLRVEKIRGKNTAILLRGVAAEVAMNHKTV